MLLKSIEDPRGPLQKARLSELQRFAKEEGVQYHPEMGAEEIRQILIAAGKTNISVPPRLLGQFQQNPTPTSHRFNQTPVPQKPVETVSWAADLARQRAQEIKDAAPSEMTITQVRQACKAKGIKISRTDKLVDLKAKLNGQDAA
jgi:hypothetical protein